ncbi:MAG TPA: topoisomerase [Ruminococcaceae bacterium]|nr:topoisomerase [Oscillospiraceae bacterium]
MPYIAPEVIQEAKKMDLLTYLQNYEPQELVHFSGNVYCTRTHDSLKISNGKWMWHSRGIGGRSALDYLIKVNDMSFIDAVEQITGRTAVTPPVFSSKPKQKKPQAFVMPHASYSASHQYLLGRGIDRDIIVFCMKTGLLLESYPHQNAVFVGMDENDNPRYAAIRGEGFMGEAAGSDKHYSFGIPAASDSTTLHLFESPIDLLSYATLLSLYGKDWRQDNLLSLSGVYRPKDNAEETAVPAALERFLENNPYIRNIVLRFDNDETGRAAVQSIRAVLPGSYEISDKPPPSGKDYNDYLCDRLGLSRAQSKERSEAR